MIDAVNEVWRPDQGQRVIINLPATVEVSTPNVFADQVELVHENIRYREHVLISVHTHDDRGCGVAAAELAVMAGADRVEGTLLGNGERTGNMDLVTAGMNLYAQGIDPEIDFSRMKEIRALVEEITEIDTHPRHPYAGIWCSPPSPAAIRTRSASAWRNTSPATCGGWPTCPSTRTIWAVATRKWCASTASPARAAWPMCWSGTSASACRAGCSRNWPWWCSATPRKTAAKSPASAFTGASTAIT